ncbi:MAG TPA: hypothetical protein VIH87_02715 [Methylocella sp.]
MNASKLTELSPSGHHAEHDGRGGHVAGQRRLNGSFQDRWAGGSEELFVAHPARASWPRLGPTLQPTEWVRLALNVCHE